MKICGNNNLMRTISRHRDVHREELTTLKKAEAPKILARTT
jgi:hypothetical protein